MAAGLYIHVPFCLARCDFCAFSLQVLREDRAQRYLDALSREIALHARDGTLEGRPPNSVYFGGGTPTTLAPARLVGILDEVRRHLGLRADAEVCVEAHPDTVTPDGLRTLVAGGVTRISFGVQSAEPEELLRVGRPVKALVPVEAVAAAREAGFTNVNLDLMYGLPAQTPESWLATLDTVLSLEPEHVSTYALTVEPGTRLDRDVRRGLAGAPAPERQNAFEEAASATLAAAGFHRYELSNYCRPGAACRHNLLYWQGGEYLGLGPSAQSYARGCRFGNAEHLTDYLAHLAAGRLPVVEREALDREQRRREAVVFGLRMIEGVPTELARGTADRQWLERVDGLIEEGLLEHAADRLRLTVRGRRFADSVAVELL